MTTYFSDGNMVTVKLKLYIDKINEVYRTIKFTAEWSKTSISFLDMTVSLIEGVIETNSYVKP